MKALTLLTSIIFLGSFADPVDPNAALMNKIEASVALPVEADPLDQYARYYAHERDGSVRAVFTHPLPKTPPDAVCMEMGRGIVPCEEPEALRPNLKAGERIWLANSDDLPLISDGGCSVIEFSVPVNIAKHPDRQWSVEAFCNGP